MWSVLKGLLEKCYGLYIPLNDDMLKSVIVRVQFEWEKDYPNIIQSLEVIAVNDGDFVSAQNNANQLVRRH